MPWGEYLSLDHVRNLGLESLCKGLTRFQRISIRLSVSSGGDPCGEICGFRAFLASGRAKLKSTRHLGAAGEFFLSSNGYSLSGSTLRCKFVKGRENRVLAKCYVCTFICVLSLWVLLLARKLCIQ